MLNNNLKMKAITFSYDDGVKQDIRLIEIFNKYGLKCTFNICSGSRSPKTDWMCEDILVSHLNAEDADGVYDGHEIACHTCNHINICKTKDKELKMQILQDRERLQEMYKTKVTGLAYPFNIYDERAVEILRKNNFHYAREGRSTHNFDMQENLFEFKPTCHHNDDRLMKLAEEFVNIKTNAFKIFYIWGHSYEFDRDRNWDYFESFCKYISGRDDTFYGTNEEVFLMQKNLLNSNRRDQSEKRII